ncbi:zinc metalloproteinase nas-1-like [Pollicipes pollicipes]|uniref:zinc metalloproteinase nas-1-like n=1 Tax=Pollicipes pollicipes TaxID=41117 RepID=UPI0018856C85|nr:zinc metalloproteinase nas-1-like [Pollicipes pollicipes]
MTAKWTANSAVWPEPMVKYGTCDSPFFDGDIFLNGLVPWAASDAEYNVGFVNSDTVPWPNGVVPYELIMHDDIRKSTLKSMHWLEENTATEETPKCIHFRPKTDEDNNYVTFTDSYPCTFSAIGMREGQQITNVGGSSSGSAQILHMLFHVLGFWHEQNRPGRNETMEVLYENVNDSLACFFDEYRNDSIGNQGLQYDVWSVMHARTNVFAESRSLSSLKPRNPNMNRTEIMKIGRLTVPSALDMRRLKTYYNCYIPPITTTAAPTTTQSTTVTEPTTTPQPTTTTEPTTTTQPTTTAASTTTAEPSTTHPTPPPNLCKDQKDGTFLPLPSDCHKFVICDHHKDKVCCCHLDEHRIPYGLG